MLLNDQYVRHRTAGLGEGLGTRLDEGDVWHAPPGCLSGRPAGDSQRAEHTAKYITIHTLFIVEFMKLTKTLANYKQIN